MPVMRDGDDWTLSKRRLADLDQDAGDMAYWLSRPVEERIGAVEALRRVMHGDDYETRCGLPRSDWPLVKLPREVRDRGGPRDGG